LGEREEFIRKLLLAAKKSLELSVDMGQIPQCHKYGMRDYDRFLYEAMPESEAEAFKRHVWECEACQIRIAKRQEEIERADEQENWRLFQNTLRVMDEADAGSKVNCLSVVLKVVERAIEVITTTGELLGGPLPESVRGLEGETIQEEYTRIVKEFKDLSLSVELKFRKLDETTELIISLFDMDKAMFMRDVNIHLAGPNIEEQKLTNDKGEVSFDIIAPGDYRATVDMGNGKTVIVDLSLSAAPG